jgi:hypothetical protein
MTKPFKILLMGLAMSTSFAQPSLGIQADWNRFALEGEESWRPRALLDWQFPFWGIRGLGSYLEQDRQVPTTQWELGAESRIGPAPLPWNLLTGMSWHKELRSSTLGDRKWREYWVGMGAGGAISPILKLEGQALWAWSDSRRSALDPQNAPRRNQSGLVLRINFLGSLPGSQ